MILFWTIIVILFSLPSSKDKLIKLRDASFFSGILIGFIVYATYNHDTLVMIISVVFIPYLFTRIMRASIALSDNK